MMQNYGSATDHVFVTMPDSNHMIYHLSHVHLWLAEVADVARVRVWIFHLVLRQVIQTFVRNSRKTTATRLIEAFKNTKTKPFLVTIVVLVVVLLLRPL